jgi:protein-disulfide isomerase
LNDVRIRALSASTPNDSRATRTASRWTKRVVADHERATSLGVDGTPTFFVNGRQLPPDAISGRHVRAAVESALAGKR